MIILDQFETVQDNASLWSYTVMTLCLVRGLLRPGRSLQSLQRRPATHVVCAVIARQVAARRAFHPDGPIVKPNEYVPRAKPNEYVPRAVDLDQFKTYCTYSDLSWKGVTPHLRELLLLTASYS